jgi:hypothetical protein
MARPYYTLLPRLFKQFSVLSAKRTLLPTIHYYATRSPLSPSGKPALFTMNILPPMMTVWHHCVRKYLGDRVDTVIFDCSGRLDPTEFPGARVQKFLNFYAATKSDEFLYHIARYRRIAWLCDDDVFPINGEAIDLLEREFAVPNTVSVSFRPRPWWHFEIDGKSYQPSSSYCIAFDQTIFAEKEHLSLAPADGNNHPSDIGKPPKRYDTGDKANEILLRKGYRCAIVPKEEETNYITGFSGISGAVMMLWHFRTPEETLAYFTSAPEEAWRGNVLFGTLSALLAICTVQECYIKLKGSPYPLPSLPSRLMLEKLCKEKESLLRKAQSFRWIDEASNRLRAVL